MIPLWTILGVAAGALCAARRGGIGRRRKRRDSAFLSALEERDRQAAVRRANHDIEVQDALRQSEARFRALVDASAQIVWTTTGAGRPAEDSPSWRAFTGQTEAEWMGGGASAAVHPDDRQQVSALWAASLAAGAPLEGEFRLRHWTGAWRWTVVRAVPLPGSEGEIRQWVGMNVDITERRMAEEASRLAARSRERERFFELSADMVCVASRAGTLVELNPAFHAGLGYVPVTLLGTSLFALVHPQDVAASMEELEHLGRDKVTVQFTNRVRHQDGSYRWLEWRAVTDEGGMVYAMARDVTSDLARSQALAQSEERLRLLVEGAVDYAIILLDASGRVASWNSGAQRLTGYAADEVRDQHVRIFCTEEARAAGHADAELQRAAAEGRYEEEDWRVRKDGSRFWANVSITALRRADGELRGFAKVTRDFTERRQAQEALRAREALLAASLQEREVLLQEVHHRVKNNLQVIVSLVNMQLRQVSDAPARVALQECQTRIQAIAAIHEKLYQSRDYVHVPFADYVETLSQSIFQALGVSPATVSLEVDVERVALPVDRAIPCGLILNELITNALKYGFPDGRRGTVRVSLRRDDSRLALTVVDDGVGLPDTFDVRSSRTLGMQVVSTLVEQLDGGLEVRRGAGGDFGVTFPMEVPS